MVGQRGRGSSRTATATVFAAVAFGRLSHSLAFVITAFTISPKHVGLVPVALALLGLLIRVRPFRSCHAPVGRDVRHRMAVTLWRSELGQNPVASGRRTQDAGYEFTRAHWEYPLSREIILSEWRWWATRPGSWRRLSGRLFSSGPENGRLGIYALLFQVLRNHCSDHVKKKH